MHVASINALRFSPEDYAKAQERERAIREIAMDLVAGTYKNLDLSRETDVLDYLLLEVRYRWAAIKDHLDAAIELARDETVNPAREGLV